MKLYAMNGKRLYIYGTPLARLNERKQEERGRPSGYIGDVDRMTLRTLKGHVCEGAPCKECEVQCGYGRRYLQLLEEKKK